MNQYPTLKESIYDCQYRFFEEELVFLYFHCIRKIDESIVLDLADRLNTVLQQLKKKRKDMTTVDWVFYLKLYYFLLVHTRDGVYGKGEHHITYMMISIWYKYFPSLTLYFIHSLVHKEIGCWRDMKYLCEYMKQNTTLKEKHPICQYCISLINEQLKKDLIHIRTNTFHMLSNVSKWIPREKKRFDWLFSLLSIHWNRTTHSYFLESEEDLIKPQESNENYYRIISKYKRNYRKKVIYASSFLNIVQKNQCSRSYIQPDKVTQYTLMKQPCLYRQTNEMVQPRQSLYDDFTNFFSKKYEIELTDDDILVSKKENHTDYSYKPLNNSSSPFLPIGSYVKEAYECLSNIKTNTSPVDTKKRIELINKQWEDYCNKQSYMTKTNSIPIIDVSSGIKIHDTESYMTIVGVALLLCRNSVYGNRILTVDSEPRWIHFEDKMSLFSMIQYLDKNISSYHSTYPHFLSSIDLLVYSIQNAIKTEEEFNMLHLVYLSVFSKDNTNDYYNDYRERFSIQYADTTLLHRIPKIVFWNVSKTNVFALPSSVYQSNVILFSGFSPYPLSYLSSTDETTITPYSMVCKVLIENNRSHYNDYIDTLLSSTK